MPNLLLAEITWRFVNPWALLLLLLIPLIAVMKGKRGPQPAVIFSSLHILRRMGPLSRSRAGAIRYALIYLSIALLAFALARPQKIRSTEKNQRKRYRAPNSHRCFTLDASHRFPHRRTTGHTIAGSKKSHP